MDKLADCLMTYESKKLKHNVDFFHDQNPIDWALDLCRRNAQYGLQIEAMGSALPELANLGKGPIKLNPKKPEVLELILGQIERAYAGHANLQLSHADSEKDITLFEPAREYYEAFLKEAANRLHPLGHYMKANLWLSASKHVYGAHVDLADGFLFQFTGVKHVKVWPIPDKCRNLAVYNYSDLKFRKSKPCIEYRLEAGDVLFIPAGAVHEVSVDVGYISLSMSFHLGCPYPLMALRNELAADHVDNRFMLKPKHKKTDKFDITFFETCFGLQDRQLTSDGMSDALCVELRRVISSDCANDKLASYMKDWWLSKLKKPTYLGPYAW